MSLITPERLTALRTKIKEECNRRKYSGSVSNNYGNIDYEQLPQEGHIIKEEHYKKNAEALNAIKGNIDTSGARVISDKEITNLETSVEALKKIDFTSANGGCNASCTGLCQGGCATGCTSCTSCSSCSGCSGCSSCSGCSGCGAACSRNCTGTCDTGCTGGCTNKCTNCTGCHGSCVRACATCEGDCSVDCFEGCGNGCSGGCGGICSMGCQYTHA